MRNKDKERKMKMKRKIRTKIKKTKIITKGEPYSKGKRLNGEKQHQKNQRNTLEQADQ